MMKTELTCPKCGAIVEKYLNPKPTVDIVIHDRERGLVLVDRKNPPYGNALPGGFIDLGESAEQAAVREAFEACIPHPTALPASIPSPPCLSPNP